MAHWHSTISIVVGCPESARDTAGPQSFKKPRFMRNSSGFGFSYTLITALSTGPIYIPGTPDNERHAELVSFEVVSAGANQFSSAKDPRSMRSVESRSSLAGIRLFSTAGIQRPLSPWPTFCPRRLIDFDSLDNVGHRLQSFLRPHSILQLFSVTLAA